MKKKNIISLAGVVALLMGLGLNLEYALDDYGLKSNSLNLFVLAQASNSGGLGVSGGISGTTGNTSGNTMTETTEKEFDAELLYCKPPRNSVETCVNFDPCK